MNPLVIFLAMCFLLKPVFPLADYLIRYDFISKELCVNKDKANSECNGKCFLKKGLADAASQTDERLPEKPKPQEILFFEETVPFVFYHKPIAPEKSLGEHDLYSFAYSADAFHPPAA